jgi:hypothetical protein
LTTQLFAKRLVALGLATAEQVLDAMEAIAAERPPIGRVAVEACMLSMRDVFRTLNAQATSGLRFGEQAMALGLIDAAGLLSLLSSQHARTPDLIEMLVRRRVASREDLRRAAKEFRRETAPETVPAD